MANVEKYTMAECAPILFHNERGASSHSNCDIDIEKTILNEQLQPNRGVSCYSYLKKRLDEVYIYGRNDVNVMCSWVVTAPKELKQEQEKQFFEEAYKFLCERYGGEKNCIQAIIHRDEGGQPHMHFCFVPVVVDTKHEQGYKVNAKEVINRSELRDFHPALQKHMDNVGLNVKVNTGITAKNGRNYTVRELKERSLEQERKHALSRFEWGL